MKNGKSQDEQLLSAEHFKFGGPSLVYLLKSIFEKIFKEGTVPKWDLPFFISHTNLSNNSRLTNSVSDL
jgi:hypothetical protein